MEHNYSEILTVKDIQKIMNIGINGAYDLVRSHSFPVKKIGRSYRIPRDGFFHWLNSYQGAAE